MSAWRFRRCPSCRQTFAAGELRAVGRFRGGWRSGSMLRACPACGHRARTREFLVVREARVRA